MAQNKKSIWSIIILVASLVTLALLVTSIVLTAVGVPSALEVAKQEAIAAGSTAEEAELIAGVAIAVVVVVLVIGSLFDVFKVIGGLLFSLKGRWGIFCIVVAVLSIAGGIYSFINGLTNHAQASNTIIDGIKLAVSLLYGCACVMHFKENRE